MAVVSGQHCHFLFCCLLPAVIKMLFQCWFGCHAGRKGRALAPWPYGAFTQAVQERMTSLILCLAS